MKQSSDATAARLEATGEGRIDERLSRAEERHRELDLRVKELDRRAYLTPKEQLEIAELKKQKLKAKDEIALLRNVRF